MKKLYVTPVLNEIVLTGQLLQVGSTNVPVDKDKDDDLIKPEEADARPMRHRSVWDEEE